MFTFEFKKLGIPKTDLNNVLLSEPFGWNIEIGWSMILFLFAVIIGLLFAYFHLRKDCKKKVDFPDYALSCLFSGLIGSRLAYILFSGGGSDIRSLLDFFNPLVGGLSYGGGIFVALIAGFICCRIKKLDALRFFDVSAVALFLSSIFGYVSDFLNGGGIGRFSSGLLWGITVNGKGPFHPLFLYHFLAAGFGFILLFIYEKFFRTHSGETFAFAAVIYGVANAVIVNYENEPLFWLGINIPFSLSLLTAISGLVLFLLLKFGFISAFQEKKAEKIEEKQTQYHEIYKPLLEGTPQNYIADKETIEESLLSAGEKNALAESKEIENTNENSEENENGSDHQR